MGFNFISPMMIHGNFMAREYQIWNVYEFNGDQETCLMTYEIQLFGDQKFSWP